MGFQISLAPELITFHFYNYNHTQYTTGTHFVIFSYISCSLYYLVIYSFSFKLYMPLFISIFLSNLNLLKIVVFKLVLMYFQSFLSVIGSPGFSSIKG